ncbi:MAG: TolC family protein [Alphaproteobacteria bacterium]|nr:TolC family protein [Alphaproteobacteria bacterium]
MNRHSYLTPAALLLLLAAPAISSPAVASPSRQHDNTLDPAQFVEAVLVSNRDIKAEDEAHRAAVARINSAGALDDPMVSYTAAPETAGTPMGYRQSIAFSQAIPWPGVLSLRAHAATEEAGSAEYQLADTRLRLAAKARAAYADWYYVHQALAINTTDIALVEHLKSVTRAAYAAGQAPQQDVLRAELELLRLQNQALDLGRRETTVQAEINQLLDTLPDAPVAPPGDLPEPPIAANLETLTDAVLAQNPALKGSDKQISASRDRVQLAEDGFLPNFNIVAGDNQLMSPWQMQYTVGVAINIPIGAKHSGDLDEAHAKLNQSQQHYYAVRDRLLADLSQTYAAVKQLHGTIDLYDKQLVPVARLNLRAAEADYSSGSGDFTKLIEAEQQYLMVELERERARADYFTQFAALDYQSGGTIFADNQESVSP